MSIFNRIFLAAIIIPVFIYGSTKPDTPVVVTDGIKLVSVKASSSSVVITWEATDERCSGKPFTIERQNPETRLWTRVAEVPNSVNTYTYEKFTVDRTTKWRVSCDITEE